MLRFGSCRLSNVAGSTISDHYSRSSLFPSSLVLVPQSSTDHSVVMLPNFGFLFLLWFRSFAALVRW